jgi:hypothetical protein
LFTARSHISFGSEGREDGAIEYSDNHYGSPQHTAKITSSVVFIILLRMREMPGSNLGPEPGNTLLWHLPAFLARDSQFLHHRCHSKLLTDVAHTAL